MDTPIFTGTDPSLWIPKVEKLFNHGRFSDDAKLDLIFLYLDGVALSWFMREMNKEKIIDWSVFKQRVLAQFAPVKNYSSSEVESFCVHEPVPTESSVQEVESISELEVETNESHMENDGVAQPQVSNSELEPSLTFSNESLDVINDLFLEQSYVVDASEGVDISELSTIVKNTQCVFQVFDKMLVRDRRRKQKLKQRKHLKAWKFKFKLMSGIRQLKDSFLFAYIGSNWERHKLKSHKRRMHTHMNRLMCRLRLRQDSSSIKQSNTSDMQPKFWSKVESGEETALTLEEAKTGICFLTSSDAQYRLQENVFVVSVLHGYTVLKASPMVYGKLQLQTMLAMDILEHEVSLLRVLAFNTPLQDRDTTLLTQFIHGDEKFQVFHKWRSKDLRFWRMNTIKNKYHVLFTSLPKMNVSCILVVSAVVRHRRTHIGTARLQVWHCWDHKGGKLQPFSELLQWGRVYPQSSEGISCLDFDLGPFFATHGATSSDEIIDAIATSISAKYIGFKQSITAPLFLNFPSTVSRYDQKNR